MSASLVHLVYSEGCDRVTASVIGNTEQLDEGTLLSQSLLLSGESSQTPSSKVISINVVCESQAKVANKYRFTSLVVEFTCSSTDPRLNCADSTIVNLGQLDLACDGSNQWSGNVRFSTSNTFTNNPQADLSTTLESRCGICINPLHQNLPTNPATSISNVTHCDRKYKYCINSLLSIVS